MYSGIGLPRLDGARDGVQIHRNVVAGIHLRRKRSCQPEQSEQNNCKRRRTEVSHHAHSRPKSISRFGPFCCGNNNHPAVRAQPVV